MDNNTLELQINLIKKNIESMELALQELVAWASSLDPVEANREIKPYLEMMIEIIDFISLTLNEIDY
ncbi:hypothetical protein ACU4YT_005712 [Pseudomonas aeruginosa]|nr:hypothetical protein [Pseudomonas aeruginosa]